MKYFNLTCLLLLTTLLIACDTKRNPSFGDTEAQFKLSTVKSISTQTLGQNSFDLANNVRFDLYVCFQDLTGKALPAKLAFAIVNGDDYVIHSTNEDGCVGWKQEILFDPLAKEKYYIITTQFISKNELQGSVIVDLALNPWKKEIKDLRKNPEAVPPHATSTRVTGAGFKIVDSVQINNEIKEDSTDASDTFTSQPINASPKDESQEVAPASFESDRTPLPSSNVFDKSANRTSTLKIALPSAVLRRVRLHPDTPYTMDEYLNLTTHEVYEFSASPKFYTAKFDSRETEIQPRRGKFQVSIAIIQEPTFDIDKVWDELNKYSSLQEVLDSTSKSMETVELQLAAQKIVSENLMKSQTILTLDHKRRLMTRVVMPYVLQTQQFETEMKPQYGLADKLTLSFNRLDLLKNRALLAFTIEPISPDIHTRIKTDAVGHATIGLQGGWRFGVLHEMKLEADLVHAERLRLEKLKKRLKPLDLYLDISRKSLGASAIKQLGSENLPYKDFIGAYKEDYPFQENLEKYFKKELNPLSEKNLLMALCYKAFIRPELSPIEWVKGDTTERMLISFNCNSQIKSLLKVEELDFVEAAPHGIQKVGQVLNRTLTVSRLISRSKESSVSKGTSTFFRGSLGLHDKSSFFIVSMGQDLYYTDTNSTSEKQTTEATSNLSFKLNVEMTQYKIKYQSRKCLKISYTESILKRLSKYSKLLNMNTVPSAFLACSQNVTEADRLEEYFIVTEDCTEDLRTTDCSAPEENRFRMVIRGKSVYDFFEKVILNTSTGVTFRAIPQSLVRHEILSWERQFNAFVTTQIFPGVFTSDLND